jgi:hypothetical protein
MLRVFAVGMGAEAFLDRGWRQVGATFERENFATLAASGVSCMYEAGGGGCGPVGGFVEFNVAHIWARRDHVCAPPVAALPRVSLCFSTTGPTPGLQAGDGACDVGSVADALPRGA